MCRRSRSQPAAVVGATATFAAIALTVAPSPAETVAVGSEEALVAAVREAKPGTTVRIAPGTYAGGHHISGLRGTPDEPVVIEAAEPQDPPVFSAAEGGSVALQLTRCAHVVLRNLKVSGFPANGINADDGGETDELATGLRFENLVIENTGPQGNHDALKLSGLSGFAVRGCTFAGWGGSAIDMVGCHDGVVEDCTFKGRDGFSQHNGVQMKGGSSGIVVRDSFFEHAGQRALNLGGSTGLPYFRPADATWEARDIEVVGNRIVGGMAAVAWVGIDGGHVHHNTIYLPEKWVLRILQENTAPRFGRCRNGVFAQNVVVIDQRVETLVNVGGQTSPETFKIRDNAWYRLDQPARGAGELPVPASGNVTGIDPELSRPGTPAMAVTSTDPRLDGLGAEAAGEAGEAAR